MENTLNRGTRIELDIKKLGINGEGIGYFERKAVFVDFALPGELSLVEITEDFNTYYKARLIETKRASAKRVVPFCPIYLECGGCQTQHMAYEETLLHKRDLILQAIKRYVKTPFNTKYVYKTIGMDDPKHYRNKASLPVEFKDGKNVVGMYKAGSNHLVDFKDCPVQDKDINKFYNLILNQMEKRKMDASNHGGHIRFIVIRKTHETNEVQITFIVNEASRDVFELGKYMADKFKEVTSVYEVVNRDPKSRDFFTNEQLLIAGKETVDEVMNDLTFKLKPDAFFQLNTVQADKLYNLIVEKAQFKKDDIVVDAYSGIAPISLYMAPHVKKVYAIEALKASHESALETILENKILNVIPMLGDVKEVLNKNKNIKPDVIVFDPPRTGLGRAVTDFLIKHKPKKIVYASCNPSTLAKDLNELLKIYEVKSITPLDMFPYTSHVETITLLSLKTA